MSTRKLRVRQAQTILPFGTGAVIDVQGESFVAAGLADWPGPKRRQQISSPRLEKKLGVTGLWAAPPAPVADYDVEDAAGPPFTRFPAWLFCGSCRRMTRWSIKDEVFGKPPSCPSCVPQQKLSPMRFVQICPDGHLGDVDWWYWAHSRLSAVERERCIDHNALNFEAGENATGLEALAVRCRNKGCENARRDLLDILGSKSMRCGGLNPWQRFRERVDCRQPVQIVQRTAGNVYYPIVHSALDIPTPAPSTVVDDEAADRVLTHDYWLVLCRTLDKPTAPGLRDLIAQAANVDPALVNALIEQETGRILGRSSVSSSGAAATSGQASQNDEKPEYPDLSWEEWAAFTAREPEYTSQFVIREVGLGAADQPPWTDLSRLVSRVVVADRLREVRALQGFTRVSPAAKVVPVDTSRKSRWLPAVEVFGEGVFIALNEEELMAWESLPAIMARTQGMARDLARSFQKDRAGAFTGPRMLPRLPLLHTLAHLLIRQLSFESGYSAASLRERVYARSPQEGQEQAQSGILIYTASGDAEGTMGGLARQGESDLLAETLMRLLEQAAWCSADPLCAEHTGQGYANLNRAACHACVLLPETSCEIGNGLLDRMLVVGGDGKTPGFLESLVRAARQEAAQAIETHRGDA